MDKETVVVMIVKESASSGMSATVPVFAPPPKHAGSCEKKSTHAPYYEDSMLGHYLMQEL